MARAKSDRARSKALAVDDLTQSIEQLQAFIPKLEDLGREGFPYLEGAQTRTELQLRECIKRAFGETPHQYLLTRRLSRMMLLGAVFASFSGVIGLYLSYYLSIASGAAIVLTATLFFLLAFLGKKIKER